MNARQPSARPLRLLSIVEATTITGPMKAVLALSRVLRSGRRSGAPVCLYLLTTRRPPLHDRPQDDTVRSAAEAAGVQFLAVKEKRLFDLGVLGRAGTAIGTVDPDIVETHDYKSHFLFLLLRARYRQLRRCKWIAFHHGYTQISPRVLLYQQLDRLTLRFANKVITMCRPFAKTVADRGVKLENIVVITNFALPRPTPPPQSLARARTNAQLDADECVIISVGRLSREKGHADLIRAFGAIVARAGSRSPRLVLVGEGPERARLLKLAAPLGTRVVFTGYLRDPWAILNSADIFALPSHSEGSPNVVFEAAAARLPIVATSVGDVPDLLETEVSALIVPPASPHQLAIALQRLINDDMLRARLAEAGSAILSKYTPTTYASRLTRIYEDCLAEQSHTE